VADEFDQLRAVGHEALIDPDGERARVGFGIIERELDVQLTIIDAPRATAELRVA
jgi:hypothetical protein